MEGISSTRHEFYILLTSTAQLHSFFLHVRNRNEVLGQKLCWKRRWQEQEQAAVAKTCWKHLLGQNVEQAPLPPLYNTILFSS